MARAPLHALPSSQTVARVAAMKIAVCIKMITQNAPQCMFYGGCTFGGAHRCIHDSSNQDRVDKQLCNVS